MNPWSCVHVIHWKYVCIHVTDVLSRLNYSFVNLELVNGSCNPIIMIRIKVRAANQILIPL